MRAVKQHNGQKVARCPCSVDFTLEAFLYKLRQPAAVVYMRVRNYNAVNLRGIERKSFVVLVTVTLMQPAVDKYFFAAGNDTVAAAGHFFIGSVKSKLHFLTPALKLYRIFNKPHLL
jgi:O-antigen/teichoic acid export membrane protein